MTRQHDMLSPPMLDTVESLVLDLLEWIGPEPRPYDDVLESWRTSCPRLPVWEDANERGLVKCHRDRDGRFVSVTSAGWQHLQEHRPRSTGQLFGTTLKSSPSVIVVGL
jgi:hypothetical protein